MAADEMGTWNYLKFPSVIELVTKAAGVSADQALNSIVIPAITGTIKKVKANLHIISLQADTPAAIKLEGAQSIQVKENAAGSYVDAITLPDGCVGSNGEMLSGIVIPGSIDVIGEVAEFNKTYDFRWHDLDFEGDDVTLTVLVELEIWFTFNTGTTDYLVGIDTWTGEFEEDYFVIAQGGVVADGSNTASTFKTDFAETKDDFYNGMLLLIYDNDNDHQIRRVSDYDGTTKFITVDVPFYTTPTAGDNLGIMPRFVHELVTTDDIWSESLPGSFTGTMAGKILDDVEANTTTLLTETQTNIPADITAIETSIIAEVDANEAKIDTAIVDIGTVDGKVDTIDGKVDTIDGIVDDLYDATILRKGTVAADGTKTVFETNLPENDDHWNNLFIVMEDGAVNSSQVRRISDFVSVDGVVTVSQPFEENVCIGDAFYVTARYDEVPDLIGIPNVTVIEDAIDNRDTIMGPEGDDLLEISNQLDAIQGTTRFKSSIPEQMQKPDSGSRGFRWVGTLRDTDEHMEDPVNNEILVRVLEADGTALTTPLCKTASLALPLEDPTDTVNFDPNDGWRAMQRLGVGQYDLFYELLHDDDEEALTVEFGWDEGSIILSQYRATEVSDEKGDIEDIQAKVTAIHVKTDAGTPSPTIPAQITTHDTDIKGLVNVKATPEFLVVPHGVTRVNVEGGITAIATTIPIYDATVSEDVGIVYIGTELISYTGISDSSLTGCTRGYNGTTPATHADQAAVYVVASYPLRLMVFDNENNMTAPDSAPTIEIVDFAGTQEIAPTAMTEISTGLYGYDYLVYSTDPPEPKTVRYSIVIDSVTTLRQSTLMMLDRPCSTSELIALVGGGNGEFAVTQDGWYDNDGILTEWTDAMAGYLRDNTSGSRLDDVLVTAYEVINGTTIRAIIPPGQTVCDSNGNYEMRLDAGTYVFKFHKDQYRFPTDEVTRVIT